MTVTVNTVSAEGLRHSVQIDEHEFFADAPTSAGGEGSAPEPHDYFDAALGACRDALTAAYVEFAEKPPLQARLFKVLRDRDPARPATRGAFVPLSDLTG